MASKRNTDYWVGKMSSKIASWSQPNSGIRSVSSVSIPASSQCLYPTPGPIALTEVLLIGEWVRLGVESKTCKWVKLFYLGSAEIIFCQIFKIYNISSNTFSSSSAVSSLWGSNYTYARLLDTIPQPKALFFFFYFFSLFV